MALLLCTRYVGLRAGRVGSLLQDMLDVAPQGTVGSAMKPGQRAFGVL